MPISSDQPSKLQAHPDGGAAPRWAPGLGWVALGDVAVVLVFVATGRSSHTEGLSLGSILGTAAPFLVALAVTWAVLTTVRLRSRGGSTWDGSWKRMKAIWPEGVTIWIGTAGLGLVLRNVVFGEGTAASFVVVAFVVLAVGLLGWRAIAAGSRRQT